MSEFSCAYEKSQIKISFNSFYEKATFEHKFLISLKNMIYLFYKLIFFFKIVLNFQKMNWSHVYKPWIVAVQKISRIGGDLKQT